MQHVFFHLKIACILLMALSQSHDVHSLLPRKELSAWPPLEEFGDVRRVTNKGDSGFGKASDRVSAEKHRL